MGITEISATDDTVASSNFGRLLATIPDTALEGAPTDTEITVEGQNIQVKGAVLLSLSLREKPFKVRTLVSPELRENLTCLRGEGAVIDLNRRVLMVGRHRRDSATFAGSPPETSGLSTQEL